MIKNIAFIPAKSISSRVPKKNFKLLNNVPLLDYSIKIAVECKFIHKVVVSSNEKIKSDIISDKIEYHVRDKEEADPNISILKLLNIWREKNNIEYDNLVLLQPTHPFRSKIHLLNSISLFQKNEIYDSLVTITNKKIRHIDGTEKLINSEKNIYQSNRFINGQIYIFRLKQEISYGENTFLYEIPESEFDINIDEPHDFRLAELLVHKFNSDIE